MNTVVTSREQILKAAKELALTGGGNQLSMRAVAAYCGIAVGSIYNYFPTKADLTIAVVAEVWQEIFHLSACPQQEESFLLLVLQLCGCIQEGMKRYPRFFAEHTLVIGDKGKGRAVMEDYFRHMEEALLQALLRDPKVRRGIWDDVFTPKAFASFVFDFLRTDLMRGQSRQDFLEQLILRAVYEGLSETSNSENSSFLP